MDWMRAVDGYCERLGAQYWAEPINAVTNLAFVGVAILMWRRCAGVVWGRVLSAVLAMIGIGSWAFHTHAQVWAGVADVVPIAVFVFIYIYLSYRFYWRFGRGAAILWTAGFVPFAAALVPVFQMVPGIGSTAGYMPVPLMIAIHAVGLRHRMPEVARGLAIGAGILMISLLARTLDGPMCDSWPSGTHFMWHLLNAVMLGWMIEVYRRQMLADAGPAR